MTDVDRDPGRGVWTDPAAGARLDAPSLSGWDIAPMALGDASAWAAFAWRTEMTRWTSHNPASVAALQDMIARAASADLSAPRLFAVRTQDSGELVATCGFHSVSALNRTAEVTYAVRPEWWGQGLATRLCEAAVAWGFARRGWVRIQATTRPGHVASQRVLTRCGFALEGRLRNFRLVRGVPEDYLMFARVPNG